MGGCVYIMASKRYGAIYVGASGQLARRVFEHKNGIVPGFTKRYGLHLLVWYECFEHIGAAVQRERAIKHWPRRWKTALVDRMNPEWEDLYPTLGI
jgi:putative endonuclease